MSALRYIVGQSEIVRVQDGRTQYVGRRLGALTTARLILTDLIGVAPTDELAKAFVEGIVNQPGKPLGGRHGMFEVDEQEIDTWAGTYGITLGKRGVRGL